MYKIKWDSLIISISLILLGCDSTPKSSDKQVQKMAMEIVVKSLRMPTSGSDNGSIALIFRLRNKGQALSTIDMRKLFLKGRDVDIALRDSIDKALSSVVDSSIDAGAIYLDSITLNGTDNTTKKSSFKAMLHLSTGALPIIYTAQYTEDGKIEVEAELNI